METIQQIGSYAGFAAVVGLAVLAALYFSQARDVKRLREWAGRAPDRMTPQVPPAPRVVARPVPKPAPPAERQAQPVSPGSLPRPATPAGAPAATPAGAGAPAPAQAAAAGAAPPAVSQDTMAHPAPLPPPPSALAPPLPPPGLGGHFAREAQLARDRAAAEGPPPEGGAPAEDDELDAERLGEDELGEDELDAEHLGEDEPGEDEFDADRLGEDEPVDDELTDEEEEDEVEGDARAEAEAAPRDIGDRPATTPTVPPPGSAPGPAPRPGSAPRPVSPSPARAPRQPLPPSRPLPPRPVPPRRPPHGPILPPYEKSRPGAPGAVHGAARSRRTVLAVGGTALFLALATFGVLQLTGGDDEPTKAPRAAEDQPVADRGGKSPAGTAVVPGDVTVSVLNGTTVGGLAAELGDKLEGQGFQLGNVTNNTDQQRAESVVLFARGAEAEAKEVGKRLGIDQREAADPDSQARAGDASVVVIAGADLNK